MLNDHDVSTVAVVALRPVKLSIGRTPQGILGGSDRGGTTDVPASKAYRGKGEEPRKQLHRSPTNEGGDLSVTVCVERVGIGLQREDEKQR